MDDTEAVYEADVYDLYVMSLLQQEHAATTDIDYGDENMGDEAYQEEGDNKDGY